MEQTQNVLFTWIAHAWSIQHCHYTPDGAALHRNPAENQVVQLEGDRCLEDVVRVQTGQGQLQQRGQVRRQIRPRVHERPENRRQRADGCRGLAKSERERTENPTKSRGQKGSGGARERRSDGMEKGSQREVEECTLKLANLTTSSKESPTKDRDAHTRYP